MINNNKMISEKLSCNQSDFLAELESALTILK